MSCDTGHGAAATFSASGLTLLHTSIDTGEETVDDVEKTHLGSVGFKEYQPGDLNEPGEVTIPYLHETDKAKPELGVVETLTITFPLGDGDATPATLVGTGYLKRIKRPNLQTNQIQDGEVMFKFDGRTGPTYTPST